MKISHTIICLILGITVIIGCQTKKDSGDNNPKNDSVTQDLTTEKETFSFQKSLQFKNFSFDVNTRGSGSLRQLNINSTGFDVADINSTLDIDGKVIDAHVADLNLDGFPELLIFTQSAGSGAYGNVIAFSANIGKSVSRVIFPPISENPKLNKGYMGHDNFLINESTLIQEFPVYKEGDPNSNPTGGTRKIQYKLKDGEASRIFVVDKIVESSSPSGH